MKIKVLNSIKKCGNMVVAFTRARHTNPFMDMLLCICMAIASMSFFYENNKYAFMLAPGFKSLVFELANIHLIPESLAFELITGIAFISKIITAFFLYIFATFCFANGLNRKYSFAIFTAAYWLVPSGYIAMYINSSPSGFLATNKLTVALFNACRHFTEISINPLSQHYYELNNTDPAVTSSVVGVVLLLFFLIGLGVVMIQNKRLSLPSISTNKRMRRI